ncbi:MAG: copper resistance protein B [Sphingomonadales bacterium]|nr:MAG: copper resistance protein B [Sphingomonadales bacterium]
MSARLSLIFIPLAMALGSTPAHAQHAHDAPATDPNCPPEHAAMGHCVPAQTPTPKTQNLAPTPATAWAADSIYDPAEMAKARAAVAKEHGGATMHQIVFNLAEIQSGKNGQAYRIDGEAWIGGDINRVVAKTEIEGEFRDKPEAELQLLYSRAIGPYFDLQAGVRQDIGQPRNRSYAVLGLEGLAPYWFEVEGALFLSNRGELSARIEGNYDARITQRLVLQPAAEIEFAAQDSPVLRQGSGLSQIELGLRLRYEIEREFAPYAGVEWSQRFGGTRRYAIADGEATSRLRVVAGIRLSL